MIRLYQRILAWESLGWTKDNTKQIKLHTNCWASGKSYKYGIHQLAHPVEIALAAYARVIHLLYSKGNLEGWLATGWSAVALFKVPGTSQLDFWSANTEFQAESYDNHIILWFSRGLRVW